VAERVYEGRFSLTSIMQSVDGAPQRTHQSGRFVLSLNGDAATLDLATPLGTTLARLHTSPQGARLQVPEGGRLREVYDHDAQSLAQNVLGYPLPLEGLRWWIQGQPEPNQPARTTLKANRVATIEQDGWAIDIKQWFDQPPTPRVLQLMRPPTAHAPEIKLNVVLDRP